MSGLSVNDHLEGILSDFEALKRSFDIDDEEDILSFSLPSPVCSPLPPASPRYFLNHTKPIVHSTLQPFTSPLSPPPHHSREPRPPRKGIPNKPLQSNGSCVTRTASFQYQLCPSSYSAMFAAGSDNDSLHSSTSSLEYSGGVSKLLSYTSPCTAEEYSLNAQHQQPLNGNFKHRKFSPESKAILDLQSPNRDEGRALGKSAAGGQFSPGFKMVNANVNTNWNGRFQNNSSFGEEHLSFNNQSQKTVTPASHRKTQQLNKFPLDLDSIVTAPSLPPDASPRASVPPRSPGSVLVSSSVSLNSLDSSDTPLHSLHEACSPVTPPSGPQRVPRVSPCRVPLSPAQAPRLLLLSGPQVGTLDSVSVSRGLVSPEAESDELKDSVGSILQRIASFSQSTLNSSTNGTSGSSGHLILPPAPSGHQRGSNLNNCSL
ncbi:uncharacterized protein [Eucyclogobius newberryi]|uniref:uncharacterized protein n=1 Tax=Eucyclogobius newberryi TaxID=166745 RepID=UPI003B5946A6